MNEAEILAQIAELEASMTPRRLREAVLNIDSGWLRQLNTEIQMLREQLPPRDLSHAE